MYQVADGEGERVNQSAGVNAEAEKKDDAQAGDVGKNLGGNICRSNQRHIGNQTGTDLLRLGFAHRDNLDTRLPMSTPAGKPEPPGQLVQNLDRQQIFYTM